MAFLNVKNQFPLNKGSALRPLCGCRLRTLRHCAKRSFNTAALLQACENQVALRNFHFFGPRTLRPSSSCQNIPPRPPQNPRCTQCKGILPGLTRRRFWGGCGGMDLRRAKNPWISFQKLDKASLLKTLRRYVSGRGSCRYPTKFSLFGDF